MKSLNFTFQALNQLRENQESSYTKDQPLPQELLNNIWSEDARPFNGIASDLDIGMTLNSDEIDTDIDFRTNNDIRVDQDRENENEFIRFQDRERTFDGKTNRLDNGDVSEGDDRSRSWKGESSRSLCEGVRCENNGSCVTEGGIARCDCRLGYTGNYCQEGMYLYTIHQFM